MYHLVVHCAANQLVLPVGRLTVTAALGVVADALKWEVVLQRLEQHAAQAPQEPATHYLFVKPGAAAPVSDCPHQIKRFGAVPQSQPPEGKAGSQLDRGIIEAAIQLLIKEYNAGTAEERAQYLVPPWFLLRCIRKEIDDQNVPAMISFFGCWQLWAKLRETGHAAMAWLMQAISEYFSAYDESGLTLEERTRRIEALYLWAARLTGNIWTTPGTLPASVGGIPTSLLRGVLNNKEARDVVLSRLPAELRDMLCERALGTDVVELVFAVTHGKLGSHFDLPTLRGSLASTSFVAGLAAQPEAERGFAMGPVSKSYACYSAEAGSSRWKDGTALPGGPRHGYHLAMHAKRAMRKANGSAQVAAVRTFHKNMGGL